MSTPARATDRFITELFCWVDDRLQALGQRKHAQARLWPSEVVTLALLFALKGVGERAFYRWLVRDYRELFPGLSDRTRLYRLFVSHRGWSVAFLADKTLLGVADTYGIERLHPIREGRSPAQLGRKGLSNHRWIVGVKLGTVRRAVETVLSMLTTISHLKHVTHRVAAYVQAAWPSPWRCSTSWCSGMG